MNRQSKNLAPSTPRTLRKRRANIRYGAATIEFALSVPLLFIVALGCIELTRYNLVKNVANQAAFEAARIGVKPGATVAEIVAEAEYQMKYVCNTIDVEVTPTAITSATNEITVVILVDIREQGWIAPQFFDDPVLQASFTIRRDNVSTF